MGTSDRLRSGHNRNICSIPDHSPQCSTKIKERMELNLYSPLCLQRAVQGRLHPMTAETSAGNKDWFGRGGGSYKRYLVCELKKC